MKMGIVRPGWLWAPSRKDWIRAENKHIWDECERGGEVPKAHAMGEAWDQQVMVYWGNHLGLKASTLITKPI